MVFSSTVFLFIFLPAFLILYFSCGNRLRNLSILCCSLFFYFWGENWFTLVLIASILIDYLCALIIAGAYGADWKRPIELLRRGERRDLRQKAALWASILTNLSILGIFKYYHFALENYNAVADLLGVPLLHWDTFIRVTLPLGVSFYTFQSMSYTFDVYLGNTRATRNLLNFACYVTMFPQLVAGPIIRYRHVEKQLVNRTVTLDSFTYGIRRFIIGLGKKVLIADVLAAPSDRVFAIPIGDLTPGLAWLGLVCFVFQLYYDFSGYSDMAIGLGHMLGFRFKENFRYPFISRSGNEFFQRWHISLNTWLRDYPYRALGGSRGGAGRAAFNVMFVLALCGLWHGASWTFVAWGLFCGAACVLERLYQLSPRTPRVPRPLRHVLVLLGFLTSMAFFRSQSLTQSFAVIKAMFGFAHGDGIVQHTGLYLNRKIFLCLICAAIGSVPFVPWLAGLYQEIIRKGRAGFVTPARMVFSLGRLLVIGFILFLSGMVLIAGSYNPFVYFRF